MFATRRIALFGALVAVLIVVGALARDDHPSHPTSADKVTTATHTTVTSPLAAAGVTSDDLHRVEPEKANAAVHGANEAPLTTSVSDTDGLKDGDVVAVRITPKDDSVVYGFEAFLCAAGNTYNVDADVRPTLTGKCVSKELTSDSDRYLKVIAEPPYRAAEGVFRVGAGTDSYAMRDGRTVSIECGRGHPCVLVIKSQFPNGFSFESIPLKFR